MKRSNSLGLKPFEPWISHGNIKYKWPHRPSPPVEIIPKTIIKSLSHDSYKNLSKAQEKFDQTDGLWQTIAKWNETTDAWMNEPFSTVNAESVNTEVQGFVKEAFSAHKKVGKVGGEFVERKCLARLGDEVCK